MIHSEAQKKAGLSDTASEDAPVLAGRPPVCCEGQASGEETAGIRVILNCRMARRPETARRWEDRKRREGER